VHGVSILSGLVVFRSTKDTPPASSSPYTTSDHISDKAGNGLNLGHDERRVHLR